MAKLKFIIRTSDFKKNTNIRVRFYDAKKFDVTASTGINVNPEFWSNAKGQLRQRIELTNEEKDRINERIKGIKNTIETEYDNTPDKSKINTEWLKTAIDKYYNPARYLQNGTTLFQFIQYFIDNADKRLNKRTGNPVSYKMKREYNVTFSYLKKYAKQYGEPDFIDIDLEFYERFVDLLRNEELATNTVGKKIQTLKIFLNAATERGVNPYTKYKSQNFAALSEETENIYLTKNEIRQFYDYDFSGNKRLEHVRDWFIILCWTAQRFGDLEQITRNHINGNFLNVRQNKTGKRVAIPLHPIVKEILEKYEYNLPKPISNQKFNQYLKEAAKIAKINSVVTKAIYSKGMKVEKQFEKHELIGSHTGRRSFCTNMYKDGFSTIAIMAISGHKSEKVFLNYIKAEPEDHAQMIWEKWQNEGEFLKVAN